MHSYLLKISHHQCIQNTYIFMLNGYAKKIPQNAVYQFLTLAVLILQ